jgi:hypothetical protein
MKLLLKRDIEESGFPAADQVDVGELVINSTTGRLYTKLTDGSIVEFISQKICFEPIPEILFFYENTAVVPPNYLINNFCCAGGLFTITVDKLKPAPFDYNFILTELTQNTLPQNISLSSPSFVTYTETENGEERTYRKATIPATISITDTNYNSISLFQFAVYDNLSNKIIRGGEKILTIKCLEGNI